MSNPHAPAHGAAHDHHDDAHGLAHVMSIKILMGVFGTLVVLTALTVFVTRFEVGRWDIAIAMAIATVKATVVALFFMHLRYDRPLNAMVFLSALIFVGLFIGFAGLDVFEYSDDVTAYHRAQATTPEGSTAVVGDAPAGGPGEPGRTPVETEIESSGEAAGEGEAPGEGESGGDLKGGTEESGEDRDEDGR